jgi:hypothetical protein
MPSIIAVDTGANVFDNEIKALATEFRLLHIRLRLNCKNFLCALLRILLASGSRVRYYVAIARELSHGTIFLIFKAAAYPYMAQTKG